MRRYWIDEDLKIGSELEISGELYKHIHIVCRQNLGDRFELISADGKLVLSEVNELKKNSFVVSLISSKGVPKIKTPYIRLVLSLPKVKTFEAVIEKSVELGVYGISPFYSEFSFFKSKDKLAEKASRLRKIVLSACQQSARFEEMLIDPILSFDGILKKLDAKRQDGKRIQALSFYEGKAQSLHDFFDQKEQSQISSSDSPDEVWVFVGSEGGFSQKEIQQFQQLNIPSLSLGEQILRVETACVSIISILKYKYGLF